MKASILLSILSMYSALGFSQAKNFIDQPYIETYASADTMVVPDKIYLNIMLNEDDEKGKIPLEQLEVQLASTLKALEINVSEDLKLDDISSNLNRYFLKQKDIIKSKIYILKVSDAVTAGKVITALEKAQISNITLQKTEYSKLEELELYLKTKAIEKARYQAELMAKPLGQKVGDAIFISDFSNSDISSALQGKVAGVQVRGNSSIAFNQETPIYISFEKIKLQSTVNIKFKLLSKDK